MAHIRKLKNGTFQAAIYVGKSTQLDKKGKLKKNMNILLVTRKGNAKGLQES